MAIPAVITTARVGPTLDKSSKKASHPQQIALLAHQVKLLEELHAQQQQQQQVADSGEVCIISLAISYDCLRSSTGISHKKAVLPLPQFQRSQARLCAFTSLSRKSALSSLCAVQEFQVSQKLERGLVRGDILQVIAADNISAALVEAGRPLREVPGPLVSCATISHLQ